MPKSKANPRQNPLSKVECTTSLESGSVISPEILAIGNLIGSMKGTLHELHDQFNLLGKEMEQVADLAQTIKVSEQIHKIRAEYKNTVKNHEEKIAALRADLQRHIAEAIQKKFYDEAKKSMRDAVQCKVSERVGRLLAKQIPNELRVQGQGHKRKILEIQTNLHNTEARRLNSSLQSPNDPLWALRSPSNLADSAGTPGTATAVELPSPTKTLPENLPKLWLLPLADLKKRVQECGVALPRPQDGDKLQLDSPRSPDSAVTLVDPNDEGEFSREQIINLFMNHIGAPFRVLPVPISAPSVAKKKMLSNSPLPYITRINTQLCFE